MSPRKIVVGIHASANSLAALRRSARETRDRQAELHAVWVAPEGAGATALATARRQLADLVRASLPGEGLVRPCLRVASGDPGPVLVGLCAEGDVLVIGACARSRQMGIFGGDVVPYCLRRAPCPVIICADHGETARPTRPDLALRV